MPPTRSPARPNSDADAATLRLLTLRLARRLRKHSGVQVTPSQLSALATLERHGQLRIGQLADREQIAKASVTRLVARLVELGFIERFPDSSDGRSWRVGVSDGGRKVLADFALGADSYLARQVASLSSVERQYLSAVLPVLRRLLEVKA